MNLPKEIDPIKAAHAGQVFTGKIPFAELSRLHDIVQSEHPIQYQWAFSQTDKGQIQSILQLRFEFSMICQRCQQPVQIVLNEARTLQFVSTEQEAEKLPLTVEPLFVNAEGMCKTHEIIEDEFILALPMIPMHTEKDCSFIKNKAYYAAQDKQSTYKPFANLSKVFDSKE